MSALTCLAPAKLNLFLHVVGRRDDGYHLLQTLFRFIELNDTLRFSVRTDGEVHRINEIEGVPEAQDLCVRAAKLLQQETGCTLGVDIELEKRIPMGGGLGGGSSDAATTMLALNRLWKLDLPRQRLMELGLTLGADVPVFIFGDNAFAEGVGEQLQRYDLPPAWYLVLCPPVHVPTAKIFTHPELTRNTFSMTMRALPIGQAFKSGRNQGDLKLGNDLQAVACKLFPEVAEHLAWLSQFAPSLMTGSGACVFAEFEKEEEAQAVLQQLPTNMRGFIAKGLQQHPLKEFAV
ncbi:MAG: 4-(cytidine 5'-diphospho)-2-C-methyl-D-erythritol kinase [Sideroxydans sp.]|nr:4-(cytidine 5'-diphospho)-2-C-methyl-D-erythritol kinase [Sideroxydans sp.]